jgi:hypothetical protein
VSTVDHEQQLTAGERALLAWTRATLAAAPSGKPGEFGRILADGFRVYFTDIPDLSLARVLLYVSAHIAGLADALKDPNPWDGEPRSELITHVAAAFTVAAADLASFELGT